MDILNDFSFKQKKYMPIFPKAIGKPTIYIEGYPCEDDEPMGATDFHAEQITTLSDQLKWYFAINKLVHIAVDSFIYYSEGDNTNVSRLISTSCSVLRNTRYVVVSIHGRREQSLLLFLNFSPIRQRAKIGMKKCKCT